MEARIHEAFRHPAPPAVVGMIQTVETDAIHISAREPSAFGLSAKMHQTHQMTQGSVLSARKRSSHPADLRKSKRVRRESVRMRLLKAEGDADFSETDSEAEKELKSPSIDNVDIQALEKVKGVSYNHKSKLWGASWYENGKRIDKAFSVSRFGAQLARAKAIQWRREREIGIPYKKPSVKGTCSQVRGVHFDQRNRQWKASWSINGRRFEKTFSVSKYGDSEAKRMAIQWRRDREAGLPYEKPKRTCEVRGVWYMRWSKTWVASWSENGKWVRKSFSVSKYGERGARQRAIECRNQHTTNKPGSRSKLESTKNVTKPSGSARAGKHADEQNNSPHLERKSNHGPAIHEAANLLVAVDHKATVTRQVNKSLRIGVGYPETDSVAQIKIENGNISSHNDGEKQAIDKYHRPTKQDGLSTPLECTNFPITPRSRRAIMRGAEALLSMLTAE